MVKSLTAIGIAAALLLGLALFEWYYVGEEFSAFQADVQSLYNKTDAEEATSADARLVLSRWEERKERLHVWIPHNDITRIDEYLSESVRLIGEQNYSLALPKLEVLLHLAVCLPDTYKPALENIL